MFNLQNMNSEHLILTSEESNKKLERIAFEIYENNFSENEIIVAGIYDKGFWTAQYIFDYLKKINSQIKFTLVKVSLDKFSPTQSAIELDVEYDYLNNKTIVLVDDVLNSGRTLAYSLRPFLKSEIKKIQIAVLVDRGHKSFPVSADYVGYALSTTLKEHINVVFDNQKIKGVYLK